MCRLYGFRSSVSCCVHQSLVAAENALARQSERHPDGWGVAYYVGRYPHLVKSEKQALVDGMFTEVSGVVSTHALVAHIRQATVGKVGLLNCHPFQHGPWIFAHNGEVSGYGRYPVIRDAVLAEITPAFRGLILGTTDSEAAFHLFLGKLAQHTPDPYADDVSLDAVLLALQETVASLRRICEPVANEAARLTFVITNGALLLGYRYNRPLHFSTHKARCPEREGWQAYLAEHCASPNEGTVNHLIVASEQVAQSRSAWCELEDGEYVAVDGAMTLRRGRL